MYKNSIATNVSRRELLTAAAAAVLPGTPAFSLEELKKSGMPGPYRGKVVEVSHPGSVVDTKIQGSAVRRMVSHGMTALTGTSDEATAWKKFFHPGDIVGIKGSPVGRPRSISQYETLLEIIRGLNLAGVPNKNIVLFERYEIELTGAGFDKIAPKGVQLGYGSKEYDDIQTSVVGYDPDTYLEFPRVAIGVDASEPVNRRSHLCLVVSKQVTKVINVSTLKDHASAGMTMALKSMSHGMNNNVSRTHNDADSNWCNEFIAKVASQKNLREKVVLQVCDGLVGTYDGGPGTWNSHFRLWDYGSLFFATDPVALDRVGWTILDKKRVSVGLPKLAETGIKLTNPGKEQFNERQPDHVFMAGKLGLGESDLARIKHNRIALK